MNLTHDYIAKLHEILRFGERTASRTGVDRIRLIGVGLDHNMSDGFPAITNRGNMFDLGQAEFLWMMAPREDGTLNVKDFEKNFWDAWARPDGDLGPIYGGQLRNFGQEGIDQWASAIKLLKSDPLSTRNVMTAWNPAQTHLMALPPCHMNHVQFLSNGTDLDLVMTQRSADWLIGVPVNLVFYGIMLLEAARLSGLRARRLHMRFNDAHVYSDQLFPEVYEMLDREYPQLGHVEIDTIDENGLASYKIIDYNYNRYFKIPVAV